MAKLSRKKSIRVSFLLAQMTLTDSQSKREEILRELIESLGITAEQAEESKESAARYLRYMASKKRREERATKPVDASGDKTDDIYQMSPAQLHEHNNQLREKLDRLLSEREKREKLIADMSDEERRRYIAELLAKRDEVLQQPAPTVEPAPQYTITDKQRRRLAAFDDLTDDDQVDSLRAMWGDL